MTQHGATPDEIPPYHQMYWPTLQAIIALGDSGSVQEINDKAIELADYSSEQQNVLHGDGPQTEIRYRMAWARSYLKAVGALENSARGIWSITDHGKSLTERDLDSITPQVRSLWLKRSRTKQLGKKSLPATIENSPENAPTLSSTDFDEWRDTLLDVLQEMDPSSFERLSQRVLRESGFTQVEVTGKSGDGGIDGIGVLRIALLSFQVFFQCKRYKGSVGAGAIRDFRGAMVGRTDKGLLLTTGSFTTEARKEATRDGAPVLDLIDGDALCTILKDLGLGVSTRQVEEVTIDPDWFASL
jgi:restriction system protein